MVYVRFESGATVLGADLFTAMSAETKGERKFAMPNHETCWELFEGELPDAPAVFWSLALLLCSPILIMIAIVAAIARCR
jgi:hypothetical protein